MRWAYGMVRERWREGDAKARREKWMGIFVDALMSHGWTMYGKPIQSCHLFTDGDVERLHEFAAAIGLKRDWFQHRDGKLPHYDLTAGKRAQAIREGATELTREEAVEKWRAMRAA